MQAAEKLGIPAAYDVRYRINAAIITDPKRAARAARQIDRNLAGQQPQQSISGAQVRSHCWEVRNTFGSLGSTTHQSTQWSLLLVVPAPLLHAIEVFP